MGMTRCQHTWMGMIRYDSGGIEKYTLARTGELNSKCLFICFEDWVRGSLGVCKPIKELTSLLFDVVEKLVQHDPCKWKLNRRYIQLWSLELRMEMGKCEMSFSNGALHMVSHTRHSCHVSREEVCTYALYMLSLFVHQAHWFPFLFCSLLLSFLRIHARSFVLLRQHLSHFPFCHCFAHNRKREQKPIRKVIWDTIYSMTIQNSEGLPVA